MREFSKMMVATLHPKRQRSVLKKFSEEKTTMILRTIGCFLTFAFGLCGLPLASGVQPAVQVPRIGYLSAGAAATSTVEVFRQQLRELGYVDGRDIMLEERWAESARAASACGHLCR